MSDTTKTEQITVQCQCGKRLKAPASAVGKRAKCPGCGNVLTIEAPPPPEADPFDAIYDLADKEQEVARQQEAAAPAQMRCPSCSTSLAPGAVICVQCGFDMRTKSKVKAKADAPGVPLGKDGKPKLAPLGGGGPKKVVDKMAPQGSFVAGVGVSAALGVGGGLIWFLVTWGTGYDVAFVCMLVGILAGVGMQIGQKGYSTMGGLAAAAITFVVMILARAAVVAAVLLPAFRSSEDNSGFDERIVQPMVEQELKSKGLDPDETTPKQDAAAHKTVIAKLKKMDKAEYQKLVDKADDDEVKEELEEYVFDDLLESKKIKEPNEAQMEQIAKEAKTKIAAMTPQQRKAELKRLEAKAEADAAAEAAKAKARGDTDESSGGGGGGGAAVAVGIVFILLIAFGWKSALFMVLALGIAYKTAAGAVSD